MRSYLRDTTRIIIALLFVGLFVFSGCNRNTALTSYNNVKAKDITIILDTSSLEFTELKARFKIQADLNGDSRSFNSDVRWKKGERIWMSFSIFGIEGVRAMFTPDSVKVLNKLGNEYYFGDYSSLSTLSEVDLTFDEIEDLLLGRLFGIQDKKPDIKFDGEQIVLRMNDKEYDAKVNLDRKTISIQQFWISSLISPRTLEVTLREYEVVEGKMWPKQRKYEIRTDDTYLKVDATSQKMILNEKLEYPFEVHPKYKRIPL